LESADNVSGSPPDGCAERREEDRVGDARDADAVRADRLPTNEACDGYNGDGVDQRCSKREPDISCLVSGT
jgi:hypothetical protein